MASMWRRAMVYLGLQDDDELDYGGEYESYGDYADPAEEPQPARPRRESAPDVPEARAVPDTGTVRPRPTDNDYATDYGADYGAPPEPVAVAAPAPMRAAARDEPSGISAPRPSVVRTIGPTTAARVHVVEPQGFNDA